MSSYKRNIISAFSIHGYTLRREALRYLQEIFEPLDTSERQESLKKILDHINTQNLTSSLLEKSHIEAANQGLTSDSSDEGILFKVFSSFSLIRHTYNSDSKKFMTWSSVHNNLPALHGNADSKADVFIERYKAIYQSIARHKVFAAPVIVTDPKEHQYKLQAVEHLLGVSGKERKVVILGMLFQLKEGKFYLEDPTGIVRINLSHTKFQQGLFTENNIVLTEGFYEDKVFYVTELGYPPIESAEVTLSHFPNFCVTPYSAINSHRLSDKLKTAEKANGDAMFVFLSDVWLDELKVIQKLQILFAGYSQIPPTCFVLIGNFLSIPIVGYETQVYEECFSQLGTIISEFPTLTKSSKFIFVPGPDDPGFSHIFPRPGIPPAFLGDFKRKVPSAIFTSNPCRIQYCSQDIVIFREDVISKMCRNCIHTPWENQEKVDIPNLFVNTVLSNGHLLPVPLNVAPVYWEYDHALWLYPLPDVLVCADKYDPYTVECSGCVVFNPGCLVRSNFSFKVYFPSVKQVEDSEIADEVVD